MKKLFGVILFLLVMASILTYRTLPGVSGDHPVLYWVTDPNPARVEQIRTFATWLRTTHPDAPHIEISVDAANSRPEKVLVQGVSGVLGDLIDHTGGPNLRFRKSVGLLDDITDAALARGFDVSQTFPAIASELQAPVKVVDEDGRTRYEMRQYAFPCNVTAAMLWVNQEAFERIDLDLPTRRWTIDEFERIGREFVVRSNPPGQIQRYFFIAGIDPIALARTAGGSIFNETETAPRVNSPVVAEAMHLRHKWTFEHPRLIPTASERNSFSASSGYGGAGLALFAEGNYALLTGGRYLLIQFRKISEERVAAGGRPMAFAVSEFPHHEMPLAAVSTRATAVYAGGRQKDLALYFMEFLASEAYNMNIVMDADALPPNPKYLELEAFKRPRDYPEEWGNHEAFSEAIQTIGVANESSPFVVDDVVSRLMSRANEYHINNLKTAEQALAELEHELRAEIQRSLAEDADLREFYDQRLVVQARIDALREAGETVPLSWISNPFLRKWYQHNGWANANE